MLCQYEVPKKNYIFSFAPPQVCEWTIYQIVTLLDISVDQFFYPDKQNEESDCRQHIDRMLNTMDENELTIMEATAEGIQNALWTLLLEKNIDFSFQECYNRYMPKTKEG